MNRRTIDERTVVAAAAAIGNHYITINEPVPFHQDILFPPEAVTALTAVMIGTKPLVGDQADKLVTYARTLDLVHPLARLVSALPDGDEPGMARTRAVHVTAFCSLARTKRMQFVAFIRDVLRAMTGRTASEDEVRLVEMSMAGMLNQALAELEEERKKGDDFEDTDFTDDDFKNDNEEQPNE